MYDKIFPEPTAEAKHRSGLLGAYFDYFVGWMRSNGYSRQTMRYNVQKVTHFGWYLHQRGIHSIHQLEGFEGKKLLNAYRHYCKHRNLGHRSLSLKVYLRVLKDTGVISDLPFGDSLLLPLTKQFLTFLRSQNNLSEKTSRRHIWWVEKFLQFFGRQKNISSIGIIDIDRFIEKEFIRLKRAPHRTYAHALRSFVRFLYHSGKIRTDFSYLIVHPRRYKLQFLPTVLPWPDIQKILDNVDRSNKAGLQHYAILLLLTTYGLRAGEVAQLRLEDIDWRNETIHIVRRKAGKDLWLPLVPEIGNAILKYLKYGRPSSKYREIFIHIHAPLVPLNSANITQVVNKYIQLVGLDPPRRGAHMLRHSFATHLIRQGVPLKQISDLLGHRDLESTHIYTKTAIEQLRKVALEVPEVK